MSGFFSKEEIKKQPQSITVPPPKKNWCLRRGKMQHLSTLPAGGAPGWECLMERVYFYSSLWLGGGVRGCDCRVALLYLLLGTHAGLLLCQPSFLKENKAVFFIKPVLLYVNVCSHHACNPFPPQIFCFKFLINYLKTALAL